MTESLGISAAAADAALLSSPDYFVQAKKLMVVVQDLDHHPQKQWVFDGGLQDIGPPPAFSAPLEGSVRITVSERASRRPCFPAEENCIFWQKCAPLRPINDCNDYFSLLHHLFDCRILHVRQVRRTETLPR
jgi:hypothetical protein